jgi:Flp pilus assembly secretin CpaC
MQRPSAPSTVSAIYAAAVATLTLIGTFGLEATRARADDLIVRYDQSQLLRMPRPVSEIIIGNPSIADVTIQGGNLLVVTGKTFGITNIIALDSDRNIIQDQRVMVERDSRSLVVVYRGTQRQTFSCGSNCSPNLMIGDEVEFFSKVSGANATKTRFSETGADSERSGQ